MRQQMMLDALDEIEQGLQAIARGHQRYGEGHRVATHDAYGTQGQHGVEALAQTVGARQLDIAIVSRLRGLSLDGVLEAAWMRGTSVSLEGFASDVRRLVPADVSRRECVEEKTR